ncbi:MAG: hypothetical protein L6455_07270 [Kiritimatiellae bacterium]|nr:hypothetical protein [Verrucomicrobiota bacterium]MBU4290732.1 hypothetical protein [Verrucomicrobiota bacterium]MCG2679750.1 hypothetical protein [Kiritimatiellia bacterium]
MTTVSNKKATVKAATEQIIIAVTKEQRRMIEKRCQQFGITPEELAADMLFGILDDDQKDNWTQFVHNAKETMRTGNHPMWEGHKEALQKLIA